MNFDSALCFMLCEGYLPNFNKKQDLAGSSDEVCDGIWIDLAFFRRANPSCFKFQIVDFNGSGMRVGSVKLICPSSK